ncbi:MFS transporter [Actinophytocola sediminis]
MNTLAFLRADKRPLAGGFLLFLLSCFGQTFFIALFSDDLRREYRLSQGEFGGVYTAATLVAALSMIRFGHLVDRHAARRVVLVTAPLLAIGAVTMALSAHVVALFAALVLLRFLGQGMMTHTSFTLMARWFTRERGRALSVATLGLNTGEALFPLLVVAMLGGLAWRQVWWPVAGVVLLLGWAVVALFGRERVASEETGADANTPAPSWTRAQALRDPSFYLVALAMAAPALIGNTVFFNQLHLTGIRGWSMAATASAFTVYALSTVVFNVVGGHLVDRLTALRAVPFFLLPLACGLILLSTVDAQWGLFAFMALYGVTNGLSLTMFGATWPEIYGTAHLGAIRSVIMAVLVVASAVGPALSGVLIDTGVSYPTQLAAMAAYCLAASALMLRIAPRLRARPAPLAAEITATGRPGSPSA